MKIAIVLSGHLRSYRDTFPSFQKLKSLLQSAGQVDVFCHTWNIEESVSVSWWKEHNDGTSPPATVNERTVAALYQPALLLIEPSKNFAEPELTIKSIIPVSGLLSMLYSQFAAYNLMKKYCAEKDICYDLVIKTRYDLEYEIAGVLTEKLMSIGTEEVLVPNSNSFELAGACADVFAAGNYHSMSEYLRFYERFGDMLASYKEFHYRELVPELALRTYLDKINIRHTELSGLRLTIVRTNGNRLNINSDIHFDLNSPNCFFTEASERSRNVLPENAAAMTENTRRLIFKYLHWIDSNASDEQLKEYTEFYNGKWIGTGKIKQLAQKCQYNKLLDGNVIKSFFERALLVSEYGLTLRLVFASVMWQAGFGTYYFRVIRKIKKL